MFTSIALIHKLFLQSLSTSYLNSDDFDGSTKAVINLPLLLHPWVDPLGEIWDTLLDVFGKGGFDQEFPKLVYFHKFPKNWKIFLQN